MVKNAVAAGDKESSKLASSEPDKPPSGNFSLDNGVSTGVDMDTSSMDNIDNVKLEGFDNTTQFSRLLDIIIIFCLIFLIHKLLIKKI